MKKTYLAILFCLLALPIAAQKQAAARQVLDATAANFSKAGGMKANFVAETFVGDVSQGATTGVIQLNGKKFQMNTSQMVVWFDGTTEWTMVKGSDEVNVSHPTAAELQAINPYAFIYIYKKGFNYTVKSTTLRGKPVYEVRLTTEDKKQELQEILLSVDKRTYDPMCIRMRRGKRDWMRIIVNGLYKGENIGDDTFRFNPKEYPKAEVIDLR